MLIHVHLQSSSWLKAEEIEFKDMKVELWEAAKIFLLLSKCKYIQTDSFQPVYEGGHEYKGYSLLRSPVMQMSDDAVSKLLTGVALRRQQETKAPPPKSSLRSFSSTFCVRLPQQRRGEDRRSRKLMHKSKCKRLPLRETRSADGRGAVWAAARCVPAEQPALPEGSNGSHLIRELMTLPAAN